MTRLIHDKGGESRPCARCGGSGTVHGIIDNDLLITGSWPCERGCAQTPPVEDKQ